MLTITRVEQERSNWCWAACIQMLITGAQRSQADIVRRVIDDCLNGESEGGDENVQLPLNALACAFAQNDLAAAFKPGTPLPGDALTYANGDFMAICFGADPSDGHVVLVSGVSQADENNPVLVIIDPRHGSAESQELDYDLLRIGANFGAGGWNGTIVSA